VSTLGPWARRLALGNRRCRRRAHASALMRVRDRVRAQSLREEESKTRALRATNTELMARLEQLERPGQALGGGAGGADVRELIESNRRLRQAPPPPSCTNWTRLVLLPVLTGHVSSFSPTGAHGQESAGGGVRAATPRRAPPPVTALPPRRARPAWLPADPFAH
jgi:hypothetical protein